MNRRGLFHRFLDLSHCEVIFFLEYGLEQTIEAKNFFRRELLK